MNVLKAILTITIFLSLSTALFAVEDSMSVLEGEVISYSKRAKQIAILYREESFLDEEEYVEVFFVSPKTSIYGRSMVVDIKKGDIIRITYTTKWTGPVYKHIAQEIDVLQLVEDK